MLPVEAPSDVTAVLEHLREHDRVAFEALRDRIRLIRSAPGHPWSQGATFRVGGQLARVCTIPVGIDVWAVAWILTEAPSIRILLVERVEG